MHSLYDDHNLFIFSTDIYSIRACAPLIPYSQQNQLYEKAIQISHIFT